MAENTKSAPKLDLKPVVRQDHKLALRLEAQKGSSRRNGEQKRPEVTDTKSRKDHLELETNTFFRSIKSESEEIIFSGEAEAWIPDLNTIIFVLTTETAYVVNPGRAACLPFLRRKPKVEMRIPFDKVEGVFQSTTSGEVVIFAPMASDLRIKSTKHQKDIVESVMLALSVFAASQCHAKIIKEIDEKLGTSARYGKLSKNRHFIASAVVTFLVKNRMAIDRKHAVNIGNKMMRQGYMRHIASTYSEFKDAHLLYTCTPSKYSTISMSAMSKDSDEKDDETLRATIPPLRKLSDENLAKYFTHKLMSPQEKKQTHQRTREILDRKTPVKRSNL